MNLFPPHCTDFYKTGHLKQYPEGTETVYSNFTCRSDQHAKVLPDFDHKNVWFGLQGVIQWLLIDTWKREFFDKPKDEVLAKYQRRMASSLGPDAVGLDHIAALHDLGYLPLRIKALPEGSRVDIRVPLFTVVNTDPKFYWVTNYVETQLSAELWKMITSATTAYEYRRLFERYAVKTGVDLSFVDFQGHDFSMRGMAGLADATQSGAAHLLSFKGTDTITAIDYLEDYYPTKSFIGGSVPATEHSVMCMGGAEDEIATFRRLITEVYPAGIVSIVSDTWDFWKVLTEFTVTIKPEILARDGKVVFRPDSGDPVKIICGSVQVTDLANKATSLDDAKVRAESIVVEQTRNDTPHGECGDGIVTGYFKYDGITYQAIVEIDWNRYDKQYYYEDGHTLKSFETAVLTPEQKGAVECLWEVFGGTATNTGYKTLDSHAGLIYGDSISLERAQAILEQLEAKGFSSANIVFGIGSYTYQFVTRDTYGSAIKATWGVVNGEARELFKDPKTDSGMKKSARGLLRVEYDNGKFVLYDRQTENTERAGLLQTVFENGVQYNKQGLDEIRNRLLVDNVGV